MCELSLFGFRMDLSGVLAMNRIVQVATSTCAIILFLVLLAPRVGRCAEIDDTTKMMRKVFEWQMGHFQEYVLLPGGERLIRRDNDWIRATFFTGVMAAYHATSDDRYLKAAISWAERNNWQPGPLPRFADDQSVGQTYIDLYRIKKDPKMLDPIRRSLDTMMAQPKPGREEWWWVDALFMAPPVFARLSTATGQMRYLDLMNRMWWDTTDFLYDREEHLYSRDKDYKILDDGSGPRTKNGRKVFWARGNGWALAGIVRVLQHLPDSYPDRDRYIGLFKEMVGKVSSLQGPDGLWRVSLLDRDEYPEPETSSSGFFCYAIAWGLNERILDRGKYLPTVERAWAGLIKSVDQDGRLGWVQLPAASPDGPSRRDTMEYGVGAFLLAGSEILNGAR